MDTLPSCRAVAFDASFTFGSAFDEYSKGGVPELDWLVRKRWVLTGFASASVRKSGIRNGYEPGGFHIDGNRVELSFLDRAALATRSESERRVLGWNDSNLFAVFTPWKNGTFAQPPSAAQVPGSSAPWTGYPAEKRESLTFLFSFWGESADLFPLWGSRPNGVGQFYCRRQSEALICMVERLIADGEAVATTGIKVWMRLEQRNLVD